MANPDNQKGFQVVDDIVGGGNTNFQSYTVSSGNTNQIGWNDPISLLPDGNVTLGAPGDGVIVAAIAKGFKDINGNSLKFLPALTAATILAIPVPGKLFEIQADAGTVINSDVINATADFIDGPLDETTGRSRYQLDSSTIGIGQQVRIIRKQAAVGTENEFGQELVNLVVAFVEDAYSDNTSI